MNATRLGGPSDAGRSRARGLALFAAVLFLFVGGCAQVAPKMEGARVDRESARRPLVRMVPATFADVARSASPAVVNISAIRRVKPGVIGFGGPGNPFYEFFKKFFGDLGPQTERKERSLGTGFIIDPKGLALTNDHVIKGAETIMIQTAGGREYPAKVLGRDAKTDLALVQIQANERFRHLSLGDSDRVEVGDWVLAIGNPFGLDHTVTAGILSGRGRAIGAGPYDDFLQTDASINPGNSGGPLLNMRGEVIGINTAIVAQGQGIGFAIPSNMAREIVGQLRRQGKVVRGWLGVAVKQVTPDLARALGLTEAVGAFVADVAAGGPAARGGIQPGDVIVAFNDRKIRESADLPTVVAAAPIGSRATVDIVRQGRVKRVTVRVGRLED